MARHRIDHDLADLLARAAASMAGGGGFFQHLLVAPLKRTVALAEVDRHCRGCRRSPAPRYGAAFGDSAPCRRCRRRTRPGLRPEAVATASARLSCVLGHLHAAPTAARGRLDQHWEADVLRRRQRFFGSWRPHRRSRALREYPPSFTVCLALILSPMMRMCSGFGPMKVSARAPERSRRSLAFSDRKP